MRIAIKSIPKEEVKIIRIVPKKELLIFTEYETLIRSELIFDYEEGTIILHKNRYGKNFNICLRCGKTYKKKHKVCVLE